MQTYKKVIDVLFLRFQRFETSLRDISSLLENWDRSTGNVVRVETPKSETEPEVTQTGSNKKMRDKKSEKEKEKEKMLKEVSNVESAMIWANIEEVEKDCLKGRKRAEKVSDNLGCFIFKSNVDLSATLNDLPLSNHQ